MSAGTTPDTVNTTRLLIYRTPSVVWRNVLAKCDGRSYFRPTPHTLTRDFCDLIAVDHHFIEYDANRRWYLPYFAAESVQRPSATGGLS